MALVQSIVSVQPVTKEPPREVGSGTLWHYVTPLGVFGAAERASDPALRRADGNGYVDPEGRPIAGVPLAPDHFLLLPSALANEIAPLEEVARDLGACVAGRRLHGCLRYTLIGGASWGTTRWLCKGVGNVRDETTARSASHGFEVVSELVDYAVTTALGTGEMTYHTNGISRYFTFR
jgi:hypothetical protein